MIETPVRSSPAMIARSSGAAPRQRGKQRWVHVEQQLRRQQRLADQRAERAHDDSRGLDGGDPRRRLLVVDVLGLLERQRRARGRCSATGGEARRRPRPRGRSGRVSDQRRAMLGARGEPVRIAAANSVVPRKTMLNVRARVGR